MERKEHILIGPEPHSPLESGTIGQYLFNSLKKYGNIPTCITDPEFGRTISYNEMLKLTCHLANGFRRDGYPVGTVISICSENNLYYLLPVIAAWYVGMIVAPTNPNQTERELLHVYNITKSEIIFCSEQTLEKIIKLKQKLPFIKKIIILNGTVITEEAVTLTNFIQFSTAEDLDVTNFQLEQFDRDNHVAVVLCSSGTTGFPKCVMLTHRHIMIRLIQSGDSNCNLGLHVKPGGAVLNILPLFHGYGFWKTLQFLTMGHHIILMQGFKEQLLLSSIEKYRIGYACFVPTVMAQLVKSEALANYDLSSLTELSVGGSPLSTHITCKALERFNIQEVRQGYGLTETTIITALTPLRSGKISSVGKLLSFTKAKVINVDTGESLGPYKIGELCIKGETVMKGYMGDANATEKAIDKSGWFHTGDACYYDEDEYLYIVDRLKELIKYKSFQVAPAELEALLVEYPGITEAAVVGKPDLVAGELPTAFIVTQPDANITEQEVLTYIKGIVSKEKQLRGGVYLIDTIPKNATGKIVRGKLREFLRKKSKL
ncbi:hypothetical protein RI129_003465 [Pyrocoelia pectoralis]|uniref:Luciferin 4-monooxygenase n=1 Tax=Pyrocoelia pectoralis TaxID=417401 RepID=A0AAN7VQI4_9COLE